MLAHLAEISLNLEIAFAISERSKFLDPAVTFIEDKKMVMELDRPCGFDDRVTFAMNFPNPPRQFFSVADCGTKAY